MAHSGIEPATLKSNVRTKARTPSRLSYSPIFDTSKLPEIRLIRSRVVASYMYMYYIISTKIKKKTPPTFVKLGELYAQIYKQTDYL